MEGAEEHLCLVDHLEVVAVLEELCLSARRRRRFLFSTVELDCH